MLKYILVSLFAFILIALAAIWVIGGGPRRLASETRASIASAVAPDDDVGFRLPWQPVEIFPTLDITEIYDFDDDSSVYGGEYFKVDDETRLAELEAEYDRLSAEASRSRTFGSPSPHAGKVAITQDVSGVRSENPREEYISIASHYLNDGAIDIAGWTLESALSGIRINIPPAASPFLAGSSNILGPISLEPGAVAVVISAPSPVGVSFRENTCTGYLGQFQQFDPPLSEECPSPSQALPLTEENLRRYGDACFDAIRSIPSCRFPQSLPESISPACRAFLMDALSYNGCVNQNRYRTTFQKDVWRIYLGTTSEIWRNSHDAVRLLDAQGKTVSVFVY